MEKEEQTVIYVPGSQYVSIANVVIAPIKRVIVSRNVPAGDWILINYADRIGYKFITTNIIHSADKSQNGSDSSVIPVY